MNSKIAGRANKAARFTGVLDAFTKMEKKRPVSSHGINPGCLPGYSGKWTDFYGGLSPPVPPCSRRNDLLKRVCVLLLPGRAP